MNGSAAQIRSPAGAGVALFDLDNTLLAGDSDYLWGEYLAAIGAVPAQEHAAENERFLRQYQRGELDVDAFLAFQLRPLTRHPTERLRHWRERFVETWIAPLVLPRARALLAEHESQGREVAIVTSTNSFITRPIAELLGVRHLLATEPEMSAGRYTGAYLGVACSGPGKVAWVESWIEREGLSLDDSWFYTDSHQDLPLLEVVSHPVAVDPDDRLREIARARRWSVISLR